MVFFSVPYEKGWTAKVNGKAVDVEKVDIGFMAVRCEAGDNSIEFSYETPGLRIGLMISAGGLLLLVIYLLVTLKRAKYERKTEPRHRYCYDYDGLLPQVAEHNSYLRYARYRRLLDEAAAEEAQDIENTPASESPQQDEPKEDESNGNDSASE